MGINEFITLQTTEIICNEIIKECEKLDKNNFSINELYNILFEIKQKIKNGDFY